MYCIHETPATYIGNGVSFVRSCCVERLADDVAAKDQEFLDRLSSQ